MSDFNGNQKTIQLFEDDNKSGADFSADRKHRYRLYRIWDETLPKVMFIGLNPSTANETEPDPTIGRVISFARSWGFGGVYMMNLFTFVTAHPEELPPQNGCDDINKALLQIYGNECARIVFAWGAFKEAAAAAKVVIPLFPGAMALRKNKDGSPIHPLYVRGDTVPVLYKTEDNK